MIDRKIGKIKVRRGTDSQRVTNTFEEGEVIYSVDKKRIFVGDDTTLGGVPVCNSNYIVESLGFPPVLPDDVLEGDIIFDKLSSRTYITRWTGTEYELLLIGDGNCCIQLQLQIDDLYTKLRTMTGCLDGTSPPPPPASKLSWVIQPTDNFVDIGDTVTFAASAVGNGAISYVWRRADTITINASNIYKNSITIPNVSIPDIAIYYCVASNAVDSITSNYVDLAIETNSILAEDGTRIMSEINEFIFWEENVVGLTITKQPVSVSTTAGTSVTFSVEAMGSPPITYQWRIGGVDVVGETKSTYTIINPTVDINSILCKVSNPAGDVFSNSANLTIIKVSAKVVNFLNTENGTRFAIGNDGGLSAWGYNSTHGVLGDGTKIKKPTPIKINLPPVSMVDGGTNHALAVGIDGSLWAWGDNSDGQLGDGTFQDKLTPIKINLPPVFMVAAGERHSLAVGVDGGLSAWGWGTSLGRGNTISSRKPIKINLPPVSMVAASNAQSFAIGIDGGLSAWGLNSRGILFGDGITLSAVSPIKINLPPVSKVESIDDERIFVVGIDGGLWAWGNNSYGQLGDGTFQDKLTPIKINLPPVSMVAAGGTHTLAVGLDGGLSAWGLNSYGQLGDGTNKFSRTPIKINLPPISVVAAGLHCSFVIGIDGGLSAWGLENYLGNGTVGTSSLFPPVKII